MQRSLRSNTAETGSSFEGSLSITERSAALYGKRKFRMYKEFTTNTSIKIVAIKPFHLLNQSLWLSSGEARLAVTADGTEGGTFAALPTVFNLNTVGAVVAPTSTITTGGTHTGGTEREVLRAASSATGSHNSGTGSTSEGIRYLAAGTYYLDIVVTGTTVGMYSLEWEEDA